MNLFEIGIKYLKVNIPCLNDDKNWHKFEKYYFDVPDYSSLENAFFEIPNSMYSQRRGKYIKYPVNEAAIMKAIHGDSSKRTCDYRFIFKQYGEDYQKLVDDLQCEIGFKIVNKNPNKNSWVVFAKALCSAAGFLSQFKDFDALCSFCTKNTPEERLQVAENILKQRGAGCTTLVMTLNWLKDIGMPEYSKPDIHLCRIMTGIFYDEFLAKGAPYTSTIKVKWAEELPKNVKVQKDVFIKTDIQAKEDGADIFAFDRLLYLIGSGDFWGTDKIFEQMKAEYAASVRGQDKDKRFIDYVISSK